MQAKALSALKTVLIEMYNDVEPVPFRMPTTLLPSMYVVCVSHTTLL